MKKDSSFNTLIISEGNFHINSISASHRYVTPPHSYARYATEHKNDRIAYIASGRLKFDMYNNKPFVAEEGTAVYIPYNIAYKSEWLGDTRGEIYSVNYVMSDDDGYQITLSPEICAFTKCDKGILEGLFVQCFNTFNQADFAYILKCKAIMLKLLYTIAVSENEYGKSKVSKAVKYIDINFLGEINIKELSEMCNLGECMFRRCFKDETGTSPLKYRNKLRIQYAYELLCEGSYSVAEAMEVTGFYDASYFNKCFKLYIGKSPSECKSQRKEASR